MTSANPIETADGRPLREIAFFHERLEFLGKAGKYVDFQGLDHLGVQIANRDPTTAQITSVVRIGLQVVKGENGLPLNDENGRWVIKPKYQKDTRSEFFKEPKILYIKATRGFTAKSDEELMLTADEEIKKHGRYDLISNSCQPWATNFFKAVNVGESTWVNVNAKLSKFSKHINSLQAAGVLAGVFVGGVLLERYEKKHSNKK